MKYTEAKLMRAHIALLGGGTTIKALARAYGYSAAELGKQLKAWRKKHDTKATSARLS